jgi:uncharacterized Tic20 family protein
MSMVILIFLKEVKKFQLSMTIAVVIIITLILMLILISIICLKFRYHISFCCDTIIQINKRTLRDQDVY